METMMIATDTAGMLDDTNQTSVPASKPATVPIMRSSDFAAVSPRLLAVTMSVVSTSQ